MAQTKRGALLVQARRHGISIGDLEARLAAGFRFCQRCEVWLTSVQFYRDRSRHDGLSRICRECKSSVSRRAYVPKPPPAKGRRFVAPRDGDKLQARRRVNYLVDAGLLPHPDTLACSDCGHKKAIDGKRHHYDHFKGYSADCHELVEPLCIPCHFKREWRRRRER